MKLLELFSGTHSVGNVAKELGYEVISVDINDYNGRYIPTHKTDIMTFNYQQYSPDEFDIIWASPRVYIIQLYNILGMVERRKVDYIQKNNIIKRC